MDETEPVPAEPVSISEDDLAALEQATEELGATLEAMAAKIARYEAIIANEHKYQPRKMRNAVGLFWPITHRSEK